mmetsp:Transcript_11090/g.27283  ORF Transcript_11090/g.27283 Transcript_11090/m.27283 type:complete len:206 (+) Transcript_11090:521-1138(+)
MIVVFSIHVLEDAADHLEISHVIIVHIIIIKLDLIVNFILVVVFVTIVLVITLSTAVECDRSFLEDASAVVIHLIPVIVSGGCSIIVSRLIGWIPKFFVEAGHRISKSVLNVSFRLGKYIFVTVDVPCGNITKGLETGVHCALIIKEYRQFDAITIVWTTHKAQVQVIIIPIQTCVQTLRNVFDQLGHCIITIIFLLLAIVVSLV